MDQTTSYDFTWLTPNRIILSTLSGLPSLADIEQADQMVLEMLDEGAAPVHIIVDCTNLARVPVNLTQVQARMTHLNHPKLGKVVAFGVNRFVRFMATAVFPFTKTPLHVTNSQEAAIAYLWQVDHTTNPAS